MKKMKGLGATIILFLMSLPYLLVAQEESGTYIDNLNAQDSSYMEQDLLADTQKSSSGNTAIIIIVAVIVIAAIVFFVIKKKKK